MAADETKKTPEAEAAVPKKADTAEGGAPAKKPAAKKPAEKAAAKKPSSEKAEAKKPAEKAAKKPAAAKPAAAKPATEKAEAKKPAAAKAAAAKKPAEKTAAKKSAETKPKAGEAEVAAEAAGKKPAAEAAEAPAEKAAPEAAGKPAAEKPARRAAGKPAAAKPGAKKPAEKPARPPRPVAEKHETEPRHGKAGLATFVDASGKELETRKLADSRFAVAADVNTLHLVVRAEQAARRSGTASTKTRGEISGSTAKLYRQKGTGRARAGSVKSPVRTGGGVVFGPKPRSFAIKVNKKVARKALAMALSDRAANGNVFVATGLELSEPSTHAVDEFLVNLDIAAPVLVVTSDEPVVAKSVRNLPYAEASEVAALSTEQVLRARSLVLTEKAFAALNEA